MSWNLSTGMKIALLSKTPTITAYKVGTTIAFGDGTGAGGADQITDSGNGLGVFGVDDYILIVGGTFHNVLIKATVVAAGAINCAAGTFTTVGAGTAIALLKISSGAFAEVLRNATAVGFTGLRPTDADAAESGIQCVVYSKNGGAFVAGASANGLNFGNMSGIVLQKAIDPATGVAEVWKGAGLITNTIGHVRVYANDKTTGASTSAVRMDGVANTSGADFNLETGTNIVTGVDSYVSTVEFDVG